jgi:hypothetical protein
MIHALFVPSQGHTVNALFRTLFDITLLRKGPEALPHSWLIFYASAAMWFAGLLAMVLVVPSLTFGDIVVDVVGWLSSVLMFAVIIVGSGHSKRLVQSLSAIVGSGAVVLAAQVLAAGILLRVTDTSTAALVVELLLFWSVFVKGNIIARTIEVHWGLGLAISVIVYVMRLLVTVSLSPAT